MKKLLLILTSAMLLAASCSSDDNDNVTFDDVKGYLTNVESVRHGLIGTWVDSSHYHADDDYATFEMTFDGRNWAGVAFYNGVEEDDDRESGTYSVTSRGDKFYITISGNNNETGEIKNRELEILILNKTTLTLRFYDEEYDEEDIYTHTRK